jgi:hypothetical protein
MNSDIHSTYSYNLIIPVERINTVTGMSIFWVIPLNILCPSIAVYVQETFLKIVLNLPWLPKSPSWELTPTCGRQGVAQTNMRRTHTHTITHKEGRNIWLTDFADCHPNVLIFCHQQNWWLLTWQSEFSGSSMQIWMWDLERNWFVGCQLGLTDKPLMGALFLRELDACSSPSCRNNQAQFFVSPRQL